MGRFAPDNPARHMRERAVGVLQPHAERLADVSDDTVARRGLVELARTDSNRRRVAALPAWPHDYNRRPHAARGPTDRERRPATAGT